MVKKNNITNNQANGGQHDSQKKRLDAVFSPQEAEEFWEEAFMLADELNYYIETSDFSDEVKLTIREFIPFMTPEQMIEFLETLKDARALGLFPAKLDVNLAVIKKITKDLQNEENAGWDKTLRNLEHIVNEEENRLNHGVDSSNST